MSKRYTFATHRLAAAFIGVLYSLPRGERGTIGVPDVPDIYHLSPGPVTLEVGWRNGPYANVAPALSATAQVRSAVDFDNAINALLGERPAQTTFRLDAGSAGNPTNHDVNIYRDGRIEVGCQGFTKETADRISAAVRDQHQPAFRLRVGNTRLSSDGVTFTVDDVDDYSIPIKELQALVKLRDEFLAGQAAAAPFHLFS